MIQKEAKLEALLFSAGQPIKKKKIAEILSCKMEEVDNIVQELQKARKDTGILICDDGEYVSLGLHPEVSSVVEYFEKDEKDSPLSKASQETLSIIAYAGPIARTDIDFLRGVNVQYTIRRLSMRGLIREQKEGQEKKWVCTTEVLNHFGISQIDELPDYHSIRKTLLEGVERAKSRLQENI